jgi:hypothetical protein
MGSYLECNRKEALEKGLEVKTETIKWTDYDEWSDSYIEKETDIEIVNTHNGWWQNYAYGDITGKIYIQCTYGRSSGLNSGIFDTLGIDYSIDI